MVADIPNVCKQGSEIPPACGLNPSLLSNQLIFKLIIRKHDINNHTYFHTNLILLSLMILYAHTDSNYMHKILNFIMFKINIISLKATKEALSVHIRNSLIFVF